MRNPVATVCFRLGALAAGLAAFASPLFAAMNDTLVPVRIDGATVIQYNYRHPEASSNYIGWRSGNTADPLFPAITDSAAAIVRGSLELASGSRLLNSSTKYSSIPKGSGQSTRLSAFIPGKAIPLDIAFSHRSLDLFPEVSDGMQEYFRAINSGDSLAFMDEVLNRETALGMGWHKNGISAGLELDAYGRWLHSPCYITYPVYTRGTIVKPWLSATNGSLHGSIVASLDRHRDYVYESKKNKEFDDGTLDVTLSRDMGTSGLATVFARLDSRKIEGGYAGISMNDTTVEHIAWTISGSIYESFHPAASADISLRLPLRNINLYMLANGALHWRPADRGTVFKVWGGNHYADRRGMEYKTAGGSILLADTLPLPLPLPLTLEAFCDWNSNPLFETMDVDGWGKVHFDVGSNREAAHFNPGARGSLDTRWRNIGLHAWGYGLVTADKGSHFMRIPRAWGLDLALGSQADSTVSATVSLASRDKMMLRYYKLNGDTTQPFGDLPPATTSLSLSTRIPFHAPVLKTHLAPVLVASAGPLYIGYERRRKEHPSAQEIGPSIRLGLESIIR